VTALPEGPAWDLSYLGVRHEYRRRGVGARAACAALRLAHAAGATQMVLAVDERNAPARRLYESLGFCETAVREVADAQRGHLTPAQSGVGQESDHLGQALDGTGQSGHLSVTQVATVGVLALRQLHTVARVAGN